MALMDIDAVEWWTFDLVREALVETAVLWRRSPGGGRWPFASDGPWHLMSREAFDYDARGGFDTSSDVALRPLPLDQDEVAWRDLVSEWIMIVPAADDRRLLALCLDFYARGYRQLPWRRIKRAMGIAHGEAGLRKRFERAVGAIAQGLNAAENRERNVSRGGMCA